jgi:hypothetical protein
MDLTLDDFHFYLEKLDSVRRKEAAARARAQPRGRR